VARVTWFSRKRREAEVTVAVPPAWRYGGPTSDNSRGSTTLTVERRGDMTSVTAAAARLTDERVKRQEAQYDSRQAEAWAMYDEVGELRYVANAIAGRCGQVELYLTLDGERVDPDDEAADPLSLITQQVMERMALNLFVGGAGYLVGIPKGVKTVEEQRSSAREGGGPAAISPEGEPQTGSEWLVCSVQELRREGTGRDRKVTVRGEQYREEDVYIERVWDPHPARWEEADSPVLSALPVLREIVGLTQHTGAQIDSRLAGAGVYWIPNTILQSAKVPETEEGQTTFSDNPVLNAIMTAMLTPMQDRSSAASVVPLLMGAPGDAIGQIRFDSFSTPFDENTKDLLEAAIRRLAQNLDAPPELLLGMGGSNHWAAWLVRDEVVTIHVAPRAELFCDALTTGWYRPIRKQLDEARKAADPAYVPVDPERYEVHADVSGLVQRPNRLGDAQALHAVRAIGDKALREAGGFEDGDAPTSREIAVAVALQVAQGNPQLLDNMAEIVRAVEALLDGTPETGPEEQSSAREPGSLTPLVPQNSGQRPLVPTAPNGAPRPGGAPTGQEGPGGGQQGAPGTRPAAV
jgi:hypothetical protein